MNQTPFRQRHPDRWALINKPAEEAVDEAAAHGLILKMINNEMVQYLGVPSLLAKIVTLVSVMVAYSTIEQIPAEHVQWNNFNALCTLLVWQHIHGLIPYDTFYREQIYRIKIDNKLSARNIVYCSCLAVFFMVYPQVNLFNYGPTNTIQSDYYWTRCILVFLYTVFNFCRFGCLDNVKMLFADGVLLSQVITIYLYNEVSFTVLLQILTPLLLLQNLKIFFNILTYVNEPTWKTNFVRMIGTHDSIFMYILFSSFIVIMAILDSMAYGRVHLITCLYAILPLYTFGSLMEFQFNKGKPLKNGTCLQFLAIILTICAYLLYLYTLQFQPCQFCNTRTYPLYQAAEKQLNEVPTTTEMIVEPESTSDQTMFEYLFSWVWQILSYYKYHGVVTWYTWCVRPVYDYILYPILSYTLFPAYTFIISLVATVHIWIAQLFDIVLQYVPLNVPINWVKNNLVALIKVFGFWSQQDVVQQQDTPDEL